MHCFLFGRLADQFFHCIILFGFNVLNQTDEPITSFSQLFDLLYFFA